MSFTPRPRLSKSNGEVAPNDNNLSLYLQSLRRCEPLPAEQQTELALLAQQGDHAARTQLIESNLRLVVFVARKYPSDYLALLDLIQAGNIGLMQAIDNFQPYRRSKFSTYAVFWIRRTINQTLAKQTFTMEGTDKTHLRLKQLAGCENDLRHRLHREPTDVEIAAQLDWRVATVRSWQRLRTAQYASDIDDPNLQDTISDPRSSCEEFVCTNDQTARVVAALATLPAQQRQVIHLYYGLNGDRPHSQPEIARLLDATVGRVAHLKRLAIQQLRQQTRLQALLDVNHAELSGVANA